MRRKTGILLASLVLILVTAHAWASSSNLEPALAVRVGPNPYFAESYVGTGAPSGRPELQGGTWWYSREWPVPQGRYVYRVYVRGIVPAEMQAVLEWHGQNEFVAINVQPSLQETEIPVTGVFKTYGHWHIEIVTPPTYANNVDAWVYVTKIQLDDLSYIYFNTPDWSALTPTTPPPQPPQIPRMGDPGTPPTYTYPTLTDPGTTPPPDPLPDIGDLSALPGAGLDVPTTPDPGPGEPGGPVADPIPVPDTGSTPDPIPVEDAVPTADPVPSADPIPVEDAVPTADPVPSADPIPVEDAVPTADPVPSADPVPTPEPVPSADPVPIADDVLPVDPILPPDQPLIPDPAPTPDPLPD